MLAFSSDWTTLAGWRGLKTRLNSLRYIKGRVAKPDARHHTRNPPVREAPSVRRGVTRREPGAIGAARRRGAGRRIGDGAVGYVV